MIEFVTLSNVQDFSSNPIIDQHRLRYDSIIKRQAWDVPNYQKLEFDQYDNPATKYLVYRSSEGKAVGSSRLYPTTLPYMLEETFSSFVTKSKIPKSEFIWEGSRFCIDNTLPADTRRKVAQHLVIGYLEAGMHFGIKEIIGLMYPAYWRHLFTQNGCNINFLGDTIKLNDGHRARAGSLPVNEHTMNCVRRKTGIYETLLNFRDSNATKHKKAA